MGKNTDLLHEFSTDSRGRSVPPGAAVRSVGALVLRIGVDALPPRRADRKRIRVPVREALDRDQLDAPTRRRPRPSSEERAPQAIRQQLLPAAPPPGRAARAFAHPAAPAAPS